MCLALTGYVKARKLQMQSPNFGDGNKLTVTNKRASLLLLSLSGLQNGAGSQRILHFIGSV